MRHIFGGKTSTKFALRHLTMHRWVMTARLLNDDDYDDSNHICQVGTEALDNARAQVMMKLMLIIMIMLI